jgi:cation transport ATPase
MTTTRLRVGKMDCAAEEQLVRMRLDTVAGIHRVDIDLANRTVAVDHEGTVKEITAALDSLDLDSAELDGHPLTEPVALVDPRREHRARAAVVRRVLVDAEPPDVAAMVVMSLLALAGNVATIVVLHRVRSSDAHIQASWIFTANDIKVNLLVIVAAAAVAVMDSAFPDLVAGAVIFVIVANGARRILRISRT